MSSELILIMDLGAIAIVLLIGLLILILHTRKLGFKLEEAQEQMYQDNQQLAYELAQRDEQQQRQTSAALNQMNNSLLNTLCAIGVCSASDGTFSPRPGRAYGQALHQHGGKPEKIRCTHGDHPHHSGIQPFPAPGRQCSETG